MRGPAARVARAWSCAGGRRKPIPRQLLVGTLLLACIGLSTVAEGALRDRLPAQVSQLLDAPPLATAVADPSGRYLLLAHRHGLVRREQLAAPSVTVAGLRVNPLTHGPHARVDYYALSLLDLASGRRVEISLPRGATIGLPNWAPDGSLFAFTLTTATGIELWLGEPGGAAAHRLLGSLNAIYSQPCSWLTDSRHMLCRRVVEDARSVASASLPLGWPSQLDPRLDNLQPAMLDEPTVRELLESQLQIVDVVSGERRPIGEPAAIQTVDPAPGGAFFLVSRIEKPYPTVSVDRAETVTEVWDGEGALVRRLPGSWRAVQWHASEPATLVWVERREGRDRVMSASPPFDGKAKELFATVHRFAGLEWLQGLSAGVLREYIPATRKTRSWLIDVADDSSPRPLVNGEGGAVAGIPVTTENRWGRKVIAVHERSIYLAGATNEGGSRRAYLTRMGLDDGETRRLWIQDGGGGFEALVSVLSPEARVLLTRYEDVDHPPEYYLIDRKAKTRIQLTHEGSRADALADVERIPLRYTRDDGYPLSATLYLPKERDPSARLPVVLWAYPKQVGAGAERVSAPAPEHFVGADRAFKLFFLLRGYAVLDDVSMPIVGDAANANDSFTEQVVANAKATIDAAAATGLVDKDRVGVAGHSYGAFMVANLLAHSRLFSAGAALSGAYNRTLTPFGFQTERRTLWEAPSTYLAMSPILYSNQIQAPLLLVHGMRDENAGTPVIQSIQFYKAIRGNGGKAELLLLPWEGHTYRSRESVLDTAAAMLDWFDRYLKTSDAPPAPVQASMGLVSK